MSEPISTRNLDRYGNAELPWSRPRDVLAADTPGVDLTFFVGTVRPDGRPHSAGVGAIWVDGDFYFETGATTRKGRNLARDPRCTLSVAADEFDLVVEGVATKVTDPTTVAAMAQRWAAGGWPARVDETGTALTAEFSAPSAGPPPWSVYRLTPHRATALSTIESGGATRWEFATT